MLTIENPKTFAELVFLGNDYSGYWFPHNLLEARGTLWGVGLGHDSSFELELSRLGYQVYGFEPEPSCFESSVVQFYGTSAKLHNFGLWDRTGHFHHTGKNISIVDIFGQGIMSLETLDIRSLWEVATALGLDQMATPRILKLNIEGAEKEILMRWTEDPLPFEVLLVQTEFLFHLGFKKLFRKFKAYVILRKILKEFKILGWTLIGFSRHQLTLIKKQSCS
jgi:hypothetical protein